MKVCVCSHNCTQAGVLLCRRTMTFEVIWGIAINVIIREANWNNDELMYNEIVQWICSSTNCSFVIQIMFDSVVMIKSRSLLI